MVLIATSSGVLVFRLDIRSLKKEEEENIAFKPSTLTIEPSTKKL